MMDTSLRTTITPTALVPVGKLQENIRVARLTGLTPARKVFSL
jgi:hypothetical protein